MPFPRRATLCCPVVLAARVLLMFDKSCRTFLPNVSEPCRPLLLALERIAQALESRPAAGALQLVVDPTSCFVSLDEMQDRRRENDISYGKRVGAYLVGI